MAIYLINIILPANTVHNILISEIDNKCGWHICIQTLIWQNDD